MSRRYDLDVKRAAVLYWLRGEKPQPEVARELGIPFETLRRWCIDREALLDGTPSDFDHRAILGLDAAPAVAEVDARQLPMFPTLVTTPASEPPAKVVPLDDPPPSVVDRLAEQQAALYADHPEVVAQAKAYAAQRLADAMATEAEARDAGRGRWAACGF
jgi:transposase-like protein